MPGFTSYAQSVVSTHTGLASNTTATGTVLTPDRENCKVQVAAAGSQTFTVALEMQYDGTNWMVIWTGSSTAAPTGAASAHVAWSPELDIVPGRSVRVIIRNTGGSAGDFVTTLVAWQQ